jgi:ribonuclease-3
MFPFAEIEGKLGYEFRNKDLLKIAFTHSSYSNTYGGKDNERLEYLGDAVLQLVVTEWQFLRDRQASEGKLTAERQKLVCKDALDSAVDGLDIMRHLLAAGGEDNIGEKAKSSLFESVTAAIYLDGGYEAAKKFIHAHGNLEIVRTSNNSIGELKETQFLTQVRYRLHILQ